MEPPTSSEEIKQQKPNIPPGMKSCDKDLLEAAAQGNQRKVRSALTAGADIRCCDDIVRGTALHYAVANGHDKVVLMLLKAGVLLEEKNKEHDTALHVAVGCGQERIVRILLEAGADETVLGKEGKTILHVAASSGNERLLRRFLDDVTTNTEVADEHGETPLHDAAASGHESMVTMLLNAGALINAADKKGETPLHCAALEGHNDIVRLLLSKGAKKESADEEGATPLHFAVYRNCVDAALTLLEAGAEVNTKMLDGTTPLHYAAEKGYEHIITIVLKAGADKDAIDKDGNTPLSLAIKDNHRGAIRVLLEAGCNTELLDRHNATQLHVAVERGLEEVVRILLEANAQRNTALPSGATALHFAARRGFANIVTLLIRAGAYKESTTMLGETPLHEAAENGHEDCVRNLLDAGACIDPRNKFGQTPLMLGCKKGCISVIRELLSYAQTAVDTVDGHNHNALCCALQCAQLGGNLEGIRLLIKYGADISSQCQQINAVLKRHYEMVHAVVDRDLEELEKLLKDDPDLEELQEAFDYAVGQGEMDIVTRLLHYKITTRKAFNIVKIIVRRPFLSPKTREVYKDILALLLVRLPLHEQIAERPELNGALMEKISQMPLDLRERCYPTLEERLIGEVRLGVVDAIDKALRAGADPNARDFEGNTALWVALLTHKDPQHSMMMLLAAGADPMVTDIRGQRLIDRAATINNGPLVRQLFLAGVPASEKITHEYLPSEIVQCAALGKTNDMLKLLSERSSLLSRQEREEALLYAATQGHADTVKTLLTLTVSPLHAHAAVSRILLRRGISLSTAERYREIQRMLAESQMNRSHRVEEKQLLDAIKKGKMGRLKEALRSGADVNAEDNEGCSALTLAARYQNHEISDGMFTLLLQAGANPQNLLAEVAHRPNLVMLIAQALQQRAALGVLENQKGTGTKRTAGQALL